MLDSVTVFFFLGGFNLVRMVWSDMKEMLVDQRISSLMMGVVLTLFFINGRVLELLLVSLFGVLLLGELKKFKFLFGVSDGDISVFSWVVPGFWFVGWFALALFLLFYVFGIFVMGRFVVRGNGFPATVPIGIAFCLTWIVVLLL